MYVDTHSHLFLDQFKTDIDEVILACKQKMVERIYLPNIDTSTISAVNNLADRFPKMCLPQMGLHPCSVKEDYKEQLQKIYGFFEKRNYAAVGEMGIDLYWDKTFVTEQIDAFKTQVEWSRELGLPLVIHSRDSLDMTIDLIVELQKGDLTGIFHCFNGSIEQAKKIEDTGFMMGMGGVITFKNSGMIDVIEYLNLESLVLETDSPYLTPAPHRGKRNESAFIPLIANKLADIKGCSAEEIAKKTTDNANKVYKYAPL